MDEVALVVGVAGAALGALGGFFVRKHVATDLGIIEVEGTQIHPQGGHKHRWTTMLADGEGWRCGVVVQPGVICGWVKGESPGAS